MGKRLFAAAASDTNFKLHHNCRNTMCRCKCLSWVANVNISAAPFPSDLGGWLGATPKIATFFIKGLDTLLIVGIIIVLIGRSIRLYFEKDSRLLRNAALIVSVAWSYWVLEGTANVIIHYYQDSSAVVGLNDGIFSKFSIHINSRHSNRRCISTTYLHSK